jgi:2'-5' RNA ligase
VIITLPPDEVRLPLEIFRRRWNEQLGAVEALRYPAHITLRTGLLCPDDQASQVAQEFLAHAALAHATDVSTDGLFFTAYGDPPRGMAGWHVPLTAGLQRLHSHLLAFAAWQKGPQVAFEPHLSLAYHDISPDQLTELRMELAGVEVPSASWRLDHVALYHEVEGSWVEWARTGLR